MLVIVMEIFINGILHMLYMYFKYYLQAFNTVKTSTLPSPREQASFSCKRHTNIDMFREKYFYIYYVV